MALLRAENITQIYNDKVIIKNVSISLDRGETISLVGASGVGKTTLFQVLSGLKSPVSGEVFLEDECINGKSGKIGYMLQKDLLLSFKTIQDNVCLPLVLNNTKRKIARETVNEVFELFGLNGTQKKYPCQLSGGMRQRVALMRTYVFGKKIMLLDEPFSALDEITKKEIHKWYIDITKKLKISTIIITHNIDEAILLSDKVYVMSGKPGEITAEILIEKSSTNDFDLTNEFLQYKREISKHLENDTANKSFGESLN